MKITNNFKYYQKDFTAETGLAVNSKTMPMYMQYYNTRIADYNMQIMVRLAALLSYQIKKNE